MNYQIAWIVACLAWMVYGVLCIRYGVQGWPGRIRWAFNGVAIIVLAWMALVFGVALLSCV